MKNSERPNGFLCDEWNAPHLDSTKPRGRGQVITIWSRINVGSSGPPFAE